MRSVLPTGTLLACLVVSACSGPSAAEKTSAAASSSPVPAVQPASVPQGENHEPLEILSVLSVEHEVDVLAQRDGLVVEINKEEGSRVKKGEVLAQLDDRTLEAQLDRARADLQVARYNVQFNEAEVKARDAALRRQQQLRQSGLSSEADLEEAKFRAKGAEYDLQGWHAIVERNQANVRELELELEQTRIRAPFDGVVARRYLRPGENVTKDEKCFRVSQLGPLLVHFQVPETSSRRPRLGDTVRVSVISDRARTFAARIERVSPTVDPASGSYNVFAKLTSPNLKALRPGMAARVLWATTAPSKE